MQPMAISRVTERRFVLGRQGLWPGRRWLNIAAVERSPLRTRLNTLLGAMLEDVTRAA